MIRLLLLTILLTLTRYTPSTASSSVNDMYVVEHISTLKGLSQNNVNDILQDSDGYMWIATNDGLNRYDGLNFKIYNSGDLGLEANQILALHEDRYKNIWIGTANNGIYCFIKEKNRFFHYSQLTPEAKVPNVEPTVRSFISTEDNKVWVVMRNVPSMMCLTLSHNNTQIDEIKRYPLKGASIVTPPSKAYTGKDLYICKGGLIYRYNKASDSFEQDSTLSSKGYTFLSTKDNNLILNRIYNLDILNPASNKITNHSLAIRSRYICWFGDRMWYANNRGLFVTKYNGSQNKFEESTQVDTYTSQTVTKIYTDRSGGVWVALASAGILRYERNNKPFKRTASIGNNLILSTSQTPDGKIWISTEGSGTFRLDSINASHPTLNLLHNDKVYDVAYCSYNNQHYISAGQRLFEYDDQTKRLTKLDWTHRYTTRKLHIKDSVIWVATYGNGLLRHNLSDNSTLHLNVSDGLPSNITRNIMRDRRGTLWICTSMGLATITPYQQRQNRPRVKALKLDHPDGNPVISILESRNGDIWYGTLGYGLGVLRYNSKTKDYTQIAHYTTRNGLPNNSAKSLVEEQKSGAIWVSTNRGLCRIDPKSRRISSYDIHDGLQEYEFNELSSCRLQNGELVFGGVKGVNYIDPTKLKIDTTSIIPIVTDIRLMDRSIFEDEELSHIMPKANQELLLSHNENTFTIAYTGLHYSNPSRNICKYKLEGVDDGWIETIGSDNTVTYKNLTPGHYKFHLMAANCDGVWSKQVYTQTISIAPPVWATWYAYIIYALTLIALIYYVFRQYHNEMKRRRAVEIANFERQKMEEMLAARTLFFTNISHEFRTPLTLILSPLQRLMRETEITENPKWSGYLRTMEHNGESLMRLINEFLSYSKEESGRLTVEISQGDIEAAGQRLFLQFEPWAEQKGITLEYISKREPIMVEYDPYLIEQITYNLVSNAIKNTNIDGKITHSLTEESDHVIISIKDSGSGIPEELQPHIFERFYSQGSHNNVGGTGIGLYLSKSLVEIHSGEIWFTTEQGVGTTFFVKLPKVQPTQSETSTTERAIKIESSPLQYEPQSKVTQQDNTPTPMTHNVESHGETLPSLLIIDDNANLRDLIQGLFVDTYTITTACDGEDGWEKILEIMPDIIISDIMMPRLSGLDLCERLKSDNRTSHIPLLLLSAKSTDLDIAAGYRNQADGYCPKPFNNDILIESVNSILHNRKLMAKRYNATLTSPQNVESTDNTTSDNDITTNTDKIFIQRISEFVENNIHNPELVVNDLCNYMGVTPLVLNKKLKSILNMTANALIRSIRLKRAAQLLKSGRYTIADVTYDVGFSDLRYFRECFKKEFGVLPNEYKDKHASE